MLVFIELQKQVDDSHNSNQFMYQPSFKAYLDALYCCFSIRVANKQTKNRCLTFIIVLENHNNNTVEVHHYLLTIWPQFQHLLPSDSRQTCVSRRILRHSIPYICKIISQTGQTFVEKWTI